MSVTGEFDRYLHALIGLLREDPQSPDRSALLSELTAATTGSDAALADRAARVLDALEGRGPKRADEGDGEPAAADRAEAEGNLASICRIVLGT
jgi:hypothetical protein